MYDNCGKTFQVNMHIKCQPMIMLWQVLIGNWILEVCVFSYVIVFLDSEHRDCTKNKNVFQQFKNNAKYQQ